MTSFYGDFLVFILGLVLLIFINDETQFESVAVIWGTWVILRESKELFEATETIFKKGYGLFNISESIIVIVYSILLIINPVEHHVHAHIILLGIELILDVLFPIINKRIEISINRIKEKRNQKL